MAVFLNETVIEVTKETLTCYAKPLGYLWRKRHYESSEIQQVLIKESVRTRQFTPIRPFDVGLVSRYTGQPVFIIRRLYNRRAAQYIKQEIEDFLGIQAN